MQHLLGLARRCIEDYQMIMPNDHIVVGVSGGKDSLVTLLVLAKLREFLPTPFRLEAITLDMGMPNMNFNPIEEYCSGIDVPYTIVREPIYEVIFEQRKEKNPCSLCAKMRRGCLNTAIINKNIRKIALGHHYDDAVETVLMNLFFEGRFSCFQPVTYLDKMGVTQIRPLLYCKESDIAKVACEEKLPVVKNTCPADGSTSRQEIKDLIYRLEEIYPDLRKRIFGAVQRYPFYGWDIKTDLSKDH